MFDIGFQELLLIGVVALIILGPERLPGAVRTATLWLTQIRRSFQQIKTDVEREIGADEINQQLHNQSIMKNLEQAKKDLQESIQVPPNNNRSDLGNLHHDNCEDSGDANDGGEMAEPKKNIVEPSAKT